MKLILQSIAATFCILSAYLLGGCASADASNQKALLSAAGFRARVPETARQKEIYAATPAYHMQRIDAKGNVFYAYKDEKEGIAYVGGEAEYQRYQQLAVQQRIARDQYMAAQMQRDMAWNWYGAYGPRFYR